jgi:hypothetical protein
MIYIVQEFYNEKWWHSSIYVDLFHAEEMLHYLRKSESDKTFRIKLFEIPEEE